MFHSPLAPAVVAIAAAVFLPAPVANAKPLCETFRSLASSAEHGFSDIRDTASPPRSVGGAANKVLIYPAVKLFDNENKSFVGKPRAAAGEFSINEHYDPKDTLDSSHYVTTINAGKTPFKAFDAFVAEMAKCFPSAKAERFRDARFKTDVAVRIAVKENLQLIASQNQCDANDMSNPRSMCSNDIYFYVYPTDETTWQIKDKTLEKTTK